MIRGLYNGAAALDVIAKQQELISSNLANLKTSGHRAVKFAVNQRENPIARNAFHELGPQVSQPNIDFSNGPLHLTDRPLDAGLVGEGFFVFDGPDGELYSRGGQFYRQPDSGTLVNIDGWVVQGESGSITIPPEVGDHEIAIATDGTISGNGQVFGKLSIVDFEDKNSLMGHGSSVFSARDNSVTLESSAVVNQFHQEYSNANPLSELVSMIIGTRQYEAVQKETTAISEALREHIRA